MKSTQTDNYFDNYMLSDYIFRKYKFNIDKYVSSVNIYPKDYKNKDNFNKRWKVYFYYTKEGKQKPVNNSSYYYNGQLIQVNRLSTHKEKVEHIEKLKKNMIRKLKTDPKLIVSLVYGYEKAVEKYPTIFGEEEKEVQHTSIKEAFALAIEYKKGKVSDRYINDLNSISNRFLKRIDETEDIQELTKRQCLDFLDHLGGSNKTYNNNKNNISTILSVLKEKEIIKENFLLSVKNLKTKPKLNKAFTESEVKALFKYLKETDIRAYGYALHIYYSIMRPVTVNRLKVKHVDLENRTFITHTKTFDFIKIIPEYLYNEFYIGLKLQNPEDYIFGRNDLVTEWDGNDQTRQNYYGKLLKPAKDKFKLSKEHTWYSFRHASAVKIYKEKCKELERQKVVNYKREAVKYLQGVFNHESYQTTLQYLRNITTLSHEDWSEYLN